MGVNWWQQKLNQMLERGEYSGIYRQLNLITLLMHMNM